MNYIGVTSLGFIVSKRADILLRRAQPHSPCRCAAALLWLEHRRITASAGHARTTSRRVILRIGGRSYKIQCMSTISTMAIGFVETSLHLDACAQNCWAMLVKRL